MKSILFTLLLMLIINIGICFSFDLNGKLLDELEYSEGKPKLKIDNNYDLHLLCYQYSYVAGDLTANNLSYFKFSYPDFNVVSSYSYYYHNGCSIGNVFPTKDGNAFLLYSYHVVENNYILGMSDFIAFIENGRIKEKSLGVYGCKRPSIISGDKLACVYPYISVYDRELQVDQIGLKEGPSTVLHRELPFDGSNVVAPKVLYINDSTMIGALFTRTDVPQTFQSYVDKYREYIGIYIYSIRESKVIRAKEISLFEDEYIESSHVAYDGIELSFDSKDSTITLISCRSHPKEDPLLCCLSLNYDLTPCRENKIIKEFSKDEYSLDDPRIEHQFFWFESSSDSTLRGTFSRFVLTSQYLYYSKSDPIRAVGNMKYKKQAKDIQKEILNAKQ